MKREICIKNDFRKASTYIIGTYDVEENVNISNVGTLNLQLLKKIFNNFAYHQFILIHSLLTCVNIKYNRALTSIAAIEVVSDLLISVLN